MGSPNGGIIGVVNPTSFGKDTVTSQTSSTPSAVTTQPGTRLIDTLVVAGGGAGGSGTSSSGNGAGGGGAGGLRKFNSLFVCGGSALGAVTIGSGGAKVPAGPNTGDSRSTRK
jgi:hypothetical protein